eukprot:EG_transcript_19673
MTWVAVDQVCEYGDPKYWDRKYQTEDTATEWFLDFRHLRSVLEEHLTPQGRILVVGCGNSTLSADMYRAGYRNITNIDLSPAAISKMRAQHQDLSGMTWLEMDATRLVFPDGTFDFVIDKGTLDALCCTEQADQLTKAMNCEIRRVLKPTGLYFMISFVEPRGRAARFAGCGFARQMDVVTIRSPGPRGKEDEACEHYVYILRPRPA